MAALILVAASLVLLYCWLVGQWFARVVVFLLFVALGLLMGQTGADHSAPLFLGVAGWFISGIPIYIRRRRYSPG